MSADASVPSLPQAPAQLPKTRGLGNTERRDRWWLSPAAVVFGLTLFAAYSLFAAIQNAHFLYTGGGAHYLSPFYSPDLESMLGFDVPFSFAFLVLWAPLGLRVTCYYYRKAYYRSYFAAPPACAVGGLKRRHYRGEARLPWILQNAHRYFLYFATIVLGFLWYDAVRAFFFRDSSGGLEAGLGLGTLVLLVNVVLLTLFTFGCNSIRHLVAGHLDCFSCSRVTRTRWGLWKRVTQLNEHHQLWAWVSLISVGLADLYVRLAAYGVFHDPRIF